MASWSWRAIPLGFRPLCIAEHGPLFARRQRERAAGEPRLPEHPLARAGHAGGGQPATASGSSDSPPRPRHAHCFFEWIYFANVASTLDDRSVYLSRSALGKELARLENVPLDADTIVVPVPDTAKAAADAMAFALEDPLGRRPDAQPLRRPDLHRGNGRPRGQGPAQVHARCPRCSKGKRVLLVEDSIVRSTTMRALVHEIRDRGGAREIHLRVACPPIIAPCFYGIDMSSKDELFATKFVDLPGGGVSEAAQQRMAKELGADSLRYLPVEAIARSVTLSPERLCRACITGRLPHRDRPAALPDRGGKGPSPSSDAASATPRAGRPDRTSLDRVQQFRLQIPDCRFQISNTCILPGFAGRSLYLASGILHCIGDL